jgi:signal peptidase II
MQTQPLTLQTRLIAFLAILIVGLVLDQWTKHLAYHHLRTQPTLSFLGDTVRLSYAENKGGFLSLGGSLSESHRYLVFVIANGVILLAIMLYLLIGSSHCNWLEVQAFSWILSGGIGNMIDRVYLGYVIDFANVGIGTLRTGIFNVADLGITFGVIAIILGNMTHPHPTQPQPPA